MYLTPTGCNVITTLNSVSFVYYMYYILLPTQRTHSDVLKLCKTLRIQLRSYYNVGITCSYAYITYVNYYPVMYVYFFRLPFCFVVVYILPHVGLTERCMQ